MAHVSRLSDYVAQGVAQNTILEGLLVSTSVSGIKGSLPNVLLAASGVVRPVFMAFVPPDNFPRPIDSRQYTAGNLQVFRSDLNTGWVDPIENGTYYRQGLSTYEAPTLTSGMLTQLHRQGTYTVTSGCWVANASLLAREAKFKVADDGTGRLQYTTNDSVAVGWVEEYDATRNYLTVTLF